MIPFPLQEPSRTETGWSIRSTLPANSAYLRGHFPGRPILPAVAQLALLTQAARRCWDREAVLSAVADLRFRGPIVPEESIQVRLGELEPGSLSRFGLYRDGRPITQGAVVWTEESSVAPAPGAGPAPFDPARGPRVLLPQEAEARYIRGVVGSDETGIECVATVPDGSPFRGESAGLATIPAFLGLELGAQAAAAHESVMRQAEGGEARSVGGYVVRCREASFAATELPADAELRVRAVLVEAAPPLRTYRIGVELDRRTLVEARVSTFAEA